MKGRAMHLSLLAYIVSAYLASADEPPRIASAVVTGEEFAPITLGTGVTWQDVPDSLAGATIFEKARKPLNELRFTVKEAGLVVLAASWKAYGNGKGDWKKDRTTDAMLLRDGWTAIGK